MDLITMSLFTDMAKMTMAAFKSLDVLHPLIVHFPVALLMVVPVFIILGMIFQKARTPLLCAALILLAMGTAASYVAFASGQAASELVTRTPEISETLARHKDLAKATRTIFSVLTLVFIFMLIGSYLIKKGSKNAIAMPIYIVFLMFYCFSLLFVMNTAHQGGILVHQYGVHAMLP